VAERQFPLRMVAWELTRNCNLNCIHCRARADSGPHEGELSTAECRRILDDLAAFTSPTIILTGGEPLLREDIFDIARYGTDKGLRLVIAVNGTLLTDESALHLKSSGIQRVSMSLDGKDAETHDAFRGVKGSFDSVIEASARLKAADLPFQINTTVTRLNVAWLDAMYDLVRGTGAVAWHLFLLVPVGRGEDLKGQELSAAAYEEVLHGLFRMEERRELEMKVTCAPHYNRIVSEEGGQVKGGGCLAGRSFMFISHRGTAQPCGYLEIPSGNVRSDGIQEVWEHSPVFGRLRNPREFTGKCGRCRFLSLCGGCRARAYAASGDFLGEEPLCSFIP
jgi:AdoMet-dependent heme synthase